MLKHAPLYAAVLALCACTSAPTVKFPSGSGTRVAINTPAKPVAVEQFTSAPAAAAASAAALPVAARRIVPKKPSGPAASDAPPEPIQLKVYLVNGNERSMLAVLRRWARLARVDFTWESDVDYPVTPRMRDIDARDLDSAIEQMRAALEGVRFPLAMAVTADGLVVQNGEAPPEPVPPAEPVVAAVATPVVTSTAEATPAAVPAPEKTPSAPAQWAVGDAKSLRDIVGKWTASAGVKLVWDSSGDEPATDLVREGAYVGTLREALGQLAGKFGEFKTPLGMKFLENGTVLRVYDMAAAS